MNNKNNFIFIYYWEMVGLCVLCLKSVDIEDDKKASLLLDLLKILSLDPWWDTSDNPPLCKHCISIVINALDFKNSCTDTEKILSPYAGRNCKVDLCSVYMKKMKIKDESRPWGIMRICRLCLRLMGNSDSYLLDFLEQSHLEDIFKIYLPEMGLGRFEEPLICEPCIDNFTKFADFVISCVDTKNKIKKYCEATNISATEQVDLKDVLRHAMYDILGGDVSYMLQKRRSRRVVEPLLLISRVKVECDRDNEMDVKEIKEISNPLALEGSRKLPVGKTTHSDFFIITKTGDRKCKHCDYKHRTASKISLHAKRKHTDIYDFPIFECNKCEYKTTIEYNLKQHSLRHKKCPDIELYQCPKCTYQTPYKAVYKGHLVSHEPPKYHCKVCSFSTKYKGGLNQHLKIHRAASEPGRFKCSLGGCEYSATERSYLTKHIRRHRTPCIEKTDTLFCLECPYKTEYKKHMRSHVARHKNGTIDVSVLRCEYGTCKYKTRLECKLVEHYERQHDCNKK